MPAESATLEALLCDASLIEHLRRTGTLGADADADDVARLAADGVSEAIALLRDAGELLGVALANLVNVFAPSLIVLGGEGMRNAPYLLPHLHRTLAAHAFGDLADHLDIVVDAWGDDAWARGAAGLAAARFLQEAAIPLDAASVHPPRPAEGGSPATSPAVPRT
jgi:predicted NBD/HSP70 family sugar kinase